MAVEKIIGHTGTAEDFEGDEAVLSRYTGLVQVALRDAYPGAVIEVDEHIGRGDCSSLSYDCSIRVFTDNPDEDTQQLQYEVEDIIQDIWNSGEYWEAPAQRR